MDDQSHRSAVRRLAPPVGGAALALVGVMAAVGLASPPEGEDGARRPPKPPASHAGVPGDRLRPVDFLRVDPLIAEGPVLRVRMQVTADAGHDAPERLRSVPAGAPVHLSFDLPGDTAGGTPRLTIRRVAAGRASTGHGSPATGHGAAALASGTGHHSRSRAPAIAPASRAPATDARPGASRARSLRLHPVARTRFHKRTTLKPGRYSLRLQAPDGRGAEFELTASAASEAGPRVIPEQPRFTGRAGHAIAVRFRVEGTRPRSPEVLAFATTAPHAGALRMPARRIRPGVYEARMVPPVPGLYQVSLVSSSADLAGARGASAVVDARSG